MAMLTRATATSRCISPQPGAAAWLSRASASAHHCNHHHEPKKHVRDGEGQKEKALLPFPFLFTSADDTPFGGSTERGLGLALGTSRASRAVLAHSGARVDITRGAFRAECRASTWIDGNARHGQNPIPETRNPKPETRNPESFTPNP